MSNIQSTPPDLKKCQHCAKLIQPAARFCPYCGKRLEQRAKRHLSVVSVVCLFIAKGFFGLAQRVRQIGGPQVEYESGVMAHSRSQAFSEKSEPNHYIKSDIMLRHMTNLEMQTVGELGERIIPKKGFIYLLSGMRIIQKLDRGYLVRADSPPEMVDDYQQAIVLYTDRELPREQMFLTGWASYEGDLEYTSLYGYTKTAHAFRLREEEPWTAAPYPYE